MDSKTLGNKIKARREYLGMNQEELAEAVGVSRVTISNWERGERGVDAIEIPILAEALTVRTAYFFDDDDIEGPNSNAYYDGLSPAKKTVADEVIRALWLEDQRNETTHGRKAE